MTETAESASSIIDYTIEMHPKLKQIADYCPLSPFARKVLTDMLEARVFSNASPDPYNPRHATLKEMELCMAMIECFIVAYGIGSVGK